MLSELTGVACSVVAFCVMGAQVWQRERAQRRCSTGAPKVRANSLQADALGTSHCKPPDPSGLALARADTPVISGLRPSAVFSWLEPRARVGSARSSRASWILATETEDSA